MNRRLKLGKYISKYGQYLVVWSFAMTLYNVIRRVGTIDAWRGETLPTLSLAETIQFTIPLIFIMALLTILSYLSRKITSTLWQLNVVYSYYWYALSLE